MNEILSNEEIDTLLHMFRSEGSAIDVDPQPRLPSGFSLPVDDRVVAPMDLLKPNRLGREQLRGIERYFESAGKLLSATMSDKLRLDARCDCVAVEQLRFGTWLDQLPGPVAIYALELKPLKLPVLFTGSTSLLYAAVDRILGGSGKITKVPKDFTAAEYTVADALVGPCLDRICESLAEVQKFEWSIQNRFCNPSMAQILPSQDVVLSIYFQASGEFLIGDLRLVLPFASIEPLLERFTRDSAAGPEPGASRQTVEKTVRSVPIEIGAQLGQAKIKLRQLLDLQIGDVIPLDARLGQPAVVPIQGKPKFTGHIGKIGNRLGLQVADVMSN
ncbi:MAG: hypothetical protein RL398_884 [Planctomycetota bacterium]|jgi:flagellar motor switch protein FliM